MPGYVLEERLGRGGTGEVWRARPRGGGPPVAVKVLVRGDPDRQTREAELLGQLDHPHLVALHEVVRREVRGGPAEVSLVLDLLEGGSLAQLLARRGRLRPGEVVTAVAPVAAALAHAHERGIVHGDLAPGNVVFTAEGRPVLTDLGVGRVLGEDGDTGGVTPPYVDPVVARGGAPGPASDVFGVAAAAFHALTGVPPWNAAGPADTLAVAAAGEVPDLALLAPEAPPELVAVVVRGLSPHPHLRGTAAAFALDLRHACRPERIAMPRTGVPDADLARTGQVSRTELTHQVRRPPRAHAAPAGEGRVARWRRTGADRVDGPRVVAVTRRVGGALGAVALVVGAVWLGVQWGGTGRADPVPAAQQASVAPTPAPAPATTSAPAPTPGPGPAATPAPADDTATPTDEAGWRAVLEQLYQRRATALVDGTADLLDGVYTADSPLGAEDTAWLEELTVSGADLQSFSPRVLAVTGVQVLPDGSGATVQLVDEVPGYALRGADGTHQDVAARGGAAVALTLARTPDGWRIDTAVATG